MRAPRSTGAVHLRTDSAPTDIQTNEFVTGKHYGSGDNVQTRASCSRSSLPTLYIKYDISPILHLLGRSRATAEQLSLAPCTDEQKTTRMRSAVRACITSRR